MLILLDLAVALFSTVDANMNNEVPYVTPARTEIHAVTYRRPMFHVETPCTFTGFVTGYDRTWDEKAPNEERIIPAEPGKTAGMAVFLTKKYCPGAAVEPILRIGTMQYTTDGQEIAKGAGIHIFDATNLTPGEVPPWMEYVAKNVDTRMQAGDLVAAELMADVAEAMALQEKKTGK